MAEDDNGGPKTPSLGIPVPPSLIKRIGDSLPPVTDVETGKVRMGFKTLVGIIVACAIGYGAYLKLSAKADAAVAHTTEERPHAAQFEAVTTKVAVMDAKIDFLIANDVEQARSDPDSHRRARRAAASVRKKMGVSKGDADDPLKGVDGL